MRVRRAITARRGRAKRASAATRRPMQQGAALPFIMTELALASWQTIMLRSLLMAQGACSTAEYRRMVWEKLDAAQRSALALAFSGGAANAMLAPWLSRARANAKRLSKR